jgi:predicted Zn-dependent protease with MMP-like domain
MQLSPEPENRALEALRDEWLSANRQLIDQKIHRGIDELEHGLGTPEDELDRHLERLKAQPE